MPKNPQASDYRMSVDRVIEPGQVTADRKIAILVTAGEAHLQLELEPADALRLADGLLAALRRMGGRPVLR
jgi:prolyl-tRNA editing enzyme YbaK/EbsC (Cys-tRNA(Pro) deacylase)